MPFVAITYDIKPGCEEQLAEIFGTFRRVGSSAVPPGAARPASGPDGPAAPATKILATALFIRDDTMVRFIEYEGDLDAVIRHMAAQPGVQEIERQLKPYLSKPRDTGTVEGFVATFKRSMLRCISQLAVPRTPPEEAERKAS
jgi:hypothetical protein